MSGHLNSTVNLQDQFAPELICFGCGPANEKGLQIKSYVVDDRVIADFQTQPHHQSFPGMVNGGIIGTLLDCHMNWTAAWHLMVRLQQDAPPCTVTAEYRVAFEAPTNANDSLHLEAWITDSSDRKAVIEATLGTHDSISVRGYGTFVAVRPGHPAYHRW